MFFFQTQSFFQKRSIFKTIVIRFLQVQNEWVVFKKDRFFPKTKQLFLKMIKKRNKKRLTIHTPLLQLFRGKILGGGVTFPLQIHIRQK